MPDRYDSDGRCQDQGVDQIDRTSQVRSAMHPSRAVDVLRQRLDELELQQVRGQQFTEWQERTEATLRRALPHGHPTQDKFGGISWRLIGATDLRGDQNVFFSGKEQATALLKAAIYELDELSDDQDVPVVLSAEEMKKVERLLVEYQRAVDEGELDSLDPDDRAEADAEVQTLSDQLRSPRPKRVIVGASLRFLRDILKSAVAGASGAGLYAALEAATKLIH